MTICLALDTAHAACTAGVVENGAALAQRHELRARGHAERLIPMVAEILAEAGQPRITQIVTTLGPGSFTGVRVAIAAAKAFALGWNCEALGVSALTALAFAHLQAHGADQNSSRTLLSTQDAGRGLIVAQLHNADAQPLEDAWIGHSDEIVARAQRENSVLLGAGITPDAACALNIAHGGGDLFPMPQTLAAMAQSGRASTQLEAVYVGGAFTPVVAR